jgi:hypothetical protein
MVRARIQTVQVSLTLEEWRVIRDLAELRRITTSDFVREGLHLLPLAQALEGSSSPAPVRRLRVDKPPPVATER